MRIHTAPQAASATDAKPSWLSSEPDALHEFLEGAQSREPVSGLTHLFYRYPARFSPAFARSAIKAFSTPGDVVLDPFMGGATTLVEAISLGRSAIGLDINSLSCFIGKAKTTVLTDSDVRALRIWFRSTVRKLNLKRPAKRATDWVEKGYQRNISDRGTWPIRKTIELFLASVARLEDPRLETFARALLLKTSQWALDCRSIIPSASEFRSALTDNFDEMAAGVSLLSSASTSTVAPTILNRSVVGIENEPELQRLAPPRLVLTSPPYPGVHVLYHRWQVLGRRETPAPYWIANSLDGHGASYYTFGSRHEENLDTYFERATASFSSLAKIAAPDATFVQMVAFSDPRVHLKRYLQAMEAAGLSEIQIDSLATRKDGRLWRRVPNRKWYADQRGSTGGSKEVVLIHRLRST